MKSYIILSFTLLFFRVTYLHAQNFNSTQKIENSILKTEKYKSIIIREITSEKYLKTLIL